MNVTELIAATLNAGAQLPRVDGQEVLGAEVIAERVIEAKVIDAGDGQTRRVLVVICP